MASRAALREPPQPPAVAIANAAPIPIPIEVPAVPSLSIADLLSGREEEIARLAARGLSNKEIGQRLGISPWTVATHLRRTFLKLEITRRIELCAFVDAVGARLTLGRA